MSRHAFNGSGFHTSIVVLTASAHTALLSINLLIQELNLFSQKLVRIWLEISAHANTAHHLLVRMLGILILLTAHSKFENPRTTLSVIMKKLTGSEKRCLLLNSGYYVMPGAAHALPFDQFYCVFSQNCLTGTMVQRNNISIFSCDEQLKKWRCHFVRSFVPLFFFSPKPMNVPIHRSFPIPRGLVWSSTDMFRRSASDPSSPPVKREMSLFSDSSVDKMYS